MNKKAIRSQVILAVVAFLVAAAPRAHAGLAVKFFGTAQAGSLSPHIAQAIERSGVDVEGFACFQLPLFDLASGRPLGIGVDCLNPFDTLGDAAGTRVRWTASASR